MGVKQGTAEKVGNWMFHCNAEQQRFIFEDASSSSKAIA